MVSGIAFTIAFLCLFEASIFKKDFFSPARVYIFTQSLTLGVAYLKLHPAMTDFHILTWAVFLCGMLSFVMGCYAVKLVFNIKPSVSNNKFAYFENYRWNRHIFFAFIMFLTFLLPAKKIFDYTGGIPIFSPKITEILSDKFSSIVGHFSYPLTLAPLIIALFGTASFSSVNPSRYLRYFSRFMVALQIVALILFYPGRGPIFISIASLVVIWNYFKKKISAKILLLGIIILIGAFIAVAQAREQYGSSSVQSLAIDKVMLLPYTYIANNYWNLDNALNPQVPRAEHPSTYGLDHFVAPIPFFGRSLREAFGWDNMFSKSIVKLRGVNTVNYLWDVYKDFGGVGVAFIPFFWGVLITWLYMRLRTTLQMRFLLLYSFAITMVGLWWFCIWYKLSFMYGFLILAIFVITELCQAKKSIKDAI